MSGLVGERRVLVVDDERVVADTLGEILRATGYDIRIAYSAEEGMDLLASWTPNLAIVDVMLPKMNGIELAVALQGSIPGCKVLLFSGQPSVEGLMEKARSEGHDFEILAKPVHPTDMLIAIATLLCHQKPGACHPL